MTTSAPEHPGLPPAILSGLNPALSLRPYQTDCFNAWLKYWARYGGNRHALHHLLFHMATGSGKTLIMAGLMLHLYTQGYRNFLFFVNSTNIIGKTRENFLNPASAKYLFAPNIIVDGKHVEICTVNNFADARPNAINLCLTTIQKLHSDLNTARENTLSYDDFARHSIVFISDEAHHMNASTRKSRSLRNLSLQQLELAFEEPDFEPSYENTALRLFNSSSGAPLPNIMLEFSATVDFDDENIADKYRHKTLFDYSLARFRRDGYSKNISVEQSQLPAMERALLAVLLSQYKRKLFASIGQENKPVILFKSRLIKENAAFHRDFISTIRSLTTSDIEHLRQSAVGDTAAIFTHLTTTGYSDENIIAELQEDFSEEKLLLVDNSEISIEKQTLLNSLESPTNKIRAIFAVDMLNEGWDVLNLFDIVRLYDTRSGGANTPGSKTVAEAQLIGRGARYMPFADHNSPTAPISSRKYDGDFASPLRLLETLHYHSPANSRYIQELNTAMVQSGLTARSSITTEMALKETFRSSDFFLKGRLYFNRREEVTAERPPLAEYLSSPLTVDIQFSKGKHRLSLSQFNHHLLRAALNRLEDFRYDKLKAHFPDLSSIREFIESERYLAGLQVQVTGCSPGTILPRTQQLRLALAILRQLAPHLPHPDKRHIGSKRLTSCPVAELLRDHSVKTDIEEDSTDSHIDGSAFAAEAWYARTACQPTTAEADFLQAFRTAMPQLSARYRQIWLIPVSGDLRIFSFTTGEVFSPGYILSLTPHSPTEAPYLYYLDCRPEHLRELYRNRAATLQQLQAVAESTYANSLFTRPHIMGRALYSQSDINTFIEEISSAQ